MRIAQLAPIYERVPPVAYGGTELVVHLLTEELVRRGHDVTLFATGDSKTSARLASVTDQPRRYGDDGPLRHAEWLQLANAQACFRAAEAGEFDLVHNHAGIEGMVLAAGGRAPVLTTNHSPYAPETAPIWSAYPWFHVAPSVAASATFPAAGRLEPVLHGIDVESHPFAETGEGYLLFLGRFSANKGPDVALEVARRTGSRLVLAGKVDAADAPWFRRRIRPALDGDRIRFVGEADAVAKRALLRGADALLFPISWDEPFGLVMVEALACGTPVIAYRRGSVPEIVEDGATGFVVEDEAGMADAIRHLRAISRRRCRRAAQERFSTARMADDYERRYATVLGAPRPAATSAPFAR